ncbi:MAG: hypothetical protein II543_01635 [Desulfovibrio sp.]|nr:hypothetical protein [Desulfovibrio sp.]
MHGCGDSAGDICRSVSREKSATFRREGSAIGNYFNRKEGFTEPWEQSPWGITVKESSSISMPFTLEDTTYLIYHHEEEAGDAISPLHSRKIDGTCPALPARPPRPARASANAGS